MALEAACCFVATGPPAFGREGASPEASGGPNFLLCRARCERLSSVRWISCTTASLSSACFSTRQWVRTSRMTSCQGRVLGEVGRVKRSAPCSKARSGMEVCRTEGDEGVLEALRTEAAAKDSAWGPGNASSRNRVRSPVHEKQHCFILLPRVDLLRTDVRTKG